MNTLSSFVLVVLRISQQGVILILLVLAAQWLFRRRLQPRWRYALWLLVRLRLALPGAIRVPIKVAIIPDSVAKFPAPTLKMRTSTTGVSPGEISEPKESNEESLRTSTATIKVQRRLVPPLQWYAPLISLFEAADGHWIGCGA